MNIPMGERRKENVVLCPDRISPEHRVGIVAVLHPSPTNSRTGEGERESAAEKASRPFAGPFVSGADRDRGGKESSFQAIFRLKRVKIMIPFTKYPKIPAPGRRDFLLAWGKEERISLTIELKPLVRERREKSEQSMGYGGMAERTSQ